ncbi:hypothetical protein BS47DRAFT_1341785 [Hydnum rufescens UP504]|uniref:Uncharacterized protein n=1 Tax=Hydnum rufescens UP504 TaxID=1448309 RepID=A0A9P6DY58_9AGAM|nr:hypothetical protein BS47DRAFT_1341785 [Hydnum rufescens UP504]
MNFIRDYQCNSQLIGLVASSSALLFLAIPPIRVSSGCSASFGRPPYALAFACGKTTYQPVVASLFPQF